MSINLIREIEDFVLSLAEKIESNRRGESVAESIAIRDRLEAGDDFADSELVYAAHDRCSCGEGMAYPIGVGIGGYWECAGILTGRAIPSGKQGSVSHDRTLPFAFYDLKAEYQPSANNGATTRPK